MSNNDKSLLCDNVATQQQFQQKKKKKTKQQSYINLCFTFFLHYFYFFQNKKIKILFFKNIYIFNIINYFLKINI